MEDLFELALLVPEAQVDSVSDALDALDALSVGVEDADAHTDAERALFGEPGLPAPALAWNRSRVTALFASEAAAQEALALLQAQDFFEPCALIAIRAVAAQDWVRLTQSQFDPVEITPTFWIVPSWHETPPAAQTVIRLDPGLAFGTGTHPTTRMCLRWLAAHRLESVLDYGCGSGILAIGAAKFGARRIDAVDIDPAAVESTRFNAHANGVEVQTGLPDMAQGLYQTVVANILASPLKVLAPLLSAHVAEGGHLVLAGILDRQVAELQAAYAPYLPLRVFDTLDAWVLMTAQRPG